MDKPKFTKEISDRAISIQEDIAHYIAEKTKDMPLQERTHAVVVGTTWALANAYHKAKRDGAAGSLDGFIKICADGVAASIALQAFREEQ